jgi:hypothetical protein
MVLTAGRSDADPVGVAIPLVIRAVVVVATGVVEVGSFIAVSSCQAALPLASVRTPGERWVSLPARRDGRHCGDTAGRGCRIGLDWSPSQSGSSLRGCVVPPHPGRRHSASTSIDRNDSEMPELARTLVAGAKPLVRSYSIRRPEIARAITICWISLVPSKIVWLTFTGFASDAQCGHVPLNRAFAIRVSAGCCTVRSVLGMSREDRPPRCAGLNYSRARDYGEYAGESVAPQWGRTRAVGASSTSGYCARVMCVRIQAAGARVCRITRGLDQGIDRSF